MTEEATFQDRLEFLEEHLRDHHFKLQELEEIIKNIEHKLTENELKELRERNKINGQLLKSSVYSKP